MVAHAYKEHDLAARIHFCNQFLQSVHNGKVDLRLVFFSYKEHDLAARIQFCNQFLQSKHNGKVDLRLLFFSYKACFSLHREVNSKNSQYWSAENPGLIHELLFHDEKIGIW